MAEISFVEDAKELMEDVEKKVGKKGLYLILGGLGLVGLYLATKSFKKPVSNEMVSASGYVGYPEVNENADVVISEISDEVTGTGSSILSYLSEMQADNNESIDILKNNIKDELNEMKSDYNTKFENIEQAQGELSNKLNSALTNGSVGGNYMDTEKGEIKDVEKVEAEKEVVSRKEYELKGQENSVFNKYYEETAGEKTNVKYIYSDGSTENKVKVDRITNEYGGQTVVRKKGDVVTTIKLDANGKTMEKTETDIHDIAKKYEEEK